MSAKVSFSNLNGHIQPAPHVSLHTERVQTDPTPLSTPSSSVEQGGVKRRYPSYSYEGDGEEEGEEEERTTGGAEGLPLEPRRWAVRVRRRVELSQPHSQTPVLRVGTWE